LVSVYLFIYVSLLAVVGAVKLQLFMWWLRGRIRFESGFLGFLWRHIRQPRTVGILVSADQ
jgi:hypothetical protein